MSSFTSALVNEQGWGEQELSRIQYYLSDDVVLERQVRENRSDIVHGEIILRDGRRIERLVFRRNTPGVLVRQIGQDKLAISFEPGKDDRFLIFSPNPRRGNAYVLIASNWSNGSGQVSYGANTYFTVPGSGLSSLMVQLKGGRQQQVRTREVGGRTVR
jgi:hypothetical protein